jgi:hypothetical protein
MSPEIDQLVCELAASLAPAQRFAFEAAARTTLATIPECQLGPGAAFRSLRELQKRFFDPPPDNRALGGPRHHGRRPSKLIAAAAVGAPDPREGARDRRRLKLVAG